MKIHINKDQLTLGLSRVIDATSNKVSMPVLCSVLLSASGESLSLYGTSLEMSASTSVKAAVAKDGAIALPAKRLQQIVREMPDGVIVIDSTGPRATISAGKARFQITGYGAKEFPESKPAIESNKVDSTCAALLGMLESVSYAQSTAPDRPILNGVCISIKDRKLSLQATNGQRLAINTKTVEAEHDASFIIPSSSVPVIKRLLSDGISVTVGMSEKGISFSVTGEGGDTLLYSAIVEGRFPDVSRAIPAKTTHGINLNREALVSALKRVSLASDELQNYVRVTAGSGVLTIRASSKTHGEAEESIECTYEGPGLDMHLGIKSLLDPLVSMSCETVSIGANNLDQPIVIRNDDPGFTYVCTPVKVL